MPLQHPGKRRLASSISSLPIMTSDPPTKHPIPHPLSCCDMRASRRRRLILYTAAFATMLALSSLLDVRRATLRDRHTKVQLVLPPSVTSLSSISADSPPQNNPHPHPNSQSPLSVRPHPIHHPPQHAPPHPHNLPPVTAKAPLQPPPASESADAPKEHNLSDQELKDDVDQLIAHVDEENAATTAAAPTNATDNPAVPVVQSKNTTTTTTTSQYSQPTVPGSTNDTNQAPVRLNSEQHFTEAKKRMELLLLDVEAKPHIDENDLRTLQALELQATRGDCEQKSVAEGGTLFKTDAEAASNVDIERTDPLWGAWCLFMGSYKTDAMRDYVQKQQFLEAKITATRLSAANNQTDTLISFDPSAASLDDVLTPEQQSALRLKTDRILAHLRQHDIRYLAALSLQATFGDCGPYGKEAVQPTTDFTEKPDLRILREPLLDQTVARRLGAQWGAWCVLQGKQRSSAATELSQRLDLLVDQLSKTEAAAQAQAQAEADEEEEKEEPKDVTTVKS